MKIYTKKKINEICELYTKHKSLRNVRKITGHSINFIKKCVKGKVNIPVYPKPLKKGYEKVNLKKVRIYAHTIFDGYISHSKSNSYNVGYVNMHAPLLTEFEKDVAKVYGLKSTRHYMKNGVFNTVCSSKLMYLDILNFDKSIVKTDERYIKTYVRAFFDDEGCVNFNPRDSRFVLSGSQHNIEEIHFLSSLLKDLGIKHNMYKFNIEIVRLKEIFRFYKLVGLTQKNKKLKLEKGFRYYRGKFNNINRQNLRIKKLHKKRLNPYKISKVINMPPSTIRNRIKSNYNNRYKFW